MQKEACKSATGGKTKKLHCSFLNILCILPFFASLREKPLAA
jgi:hypothetical protein